MTPNEIKDIVREVLREEFGNYFKSDANITFSKSIRILPPSGFDGSLGSSGGYAGVYGQSTTRASAISAPNTPSATYSQSEAQSTVNSVNNIRTALTNFGITL